MGGRHLTQHVGGSQRKMCQSQFDSEGPGFYLIENGKLIQWTWEDFHKLTTFFPLLLRFRHCPLLCVDWDLHQLIESIAAWTQPWIWFPTLHKLDIVAVISDWAEVGWSEVEGHPWLLCEFQVSLGYMRPCMHIIETRGSCIPDYGLFVLWLDNSEIKILIFSEVIWLNFLSS